VLAKETRSSTWKWNSIENIRPSFVSLYVSIFHPAMDIRRPSFAFDFIFQFFFLCFHCNNPMIRNKKKKNVTWLCSPLQHPKQEQQIITEDKIRRQKEKKTVRKKRERKKFSFRIRQFFYMIQ